MAKLLLALASQEILGAVRSDSAFDTTDIDSMDAFCFRLLEAAMLPLREDATETDTEATRS